MCDHEIVMRVKIRVEVEDGRGRGESCERVFFFGEEERKLA